MTLHAPHPPGRYKLRTRDYEMLAAAGALDGLRTELIDGGIVVLSPQYRPHGFIKDELAYRLRRALESMGAALHVATEQSVVLAAHSEPMPDVILTSEPQGVGGIPGFSVRLIVEVSDTTLIMDLDEKAGLYAAAGVPEYWVADVNGRVVHQLWLPTDDGYAERGTIAFGQAIEAATIDGLVVTVPEN